MRAEASLEHGVITSLKDDYGFLRSNKRQEQVFELEDEGDDNGSEKKGDSLVLKEGQDMKFLVVTEGEEGQLWCCMSACRVQMQMQPRGSVRFHDVLAGGVMGIVIMVSQPQDSENALALRERFVCQLFYYPTRSEGWLYVVEIQQVTFGKTIRVLSYFRQLLLWACVS